MLQSFKQYTIKLVDTPFIEEFEKSSKSFANQLIKSKNIDINSLFSFEEFEQFNMDKISFSDAWQGIKLKAYKPQDYVHSIQYCAIVGGTLKDTSYGQTFDRIAILPNWLNGQLTIIKEEVHIIEAEQRILFLGRAVSPEQAQFTLGPFFKKEYLDNKAPIFHVEHGLAGTQHNPINTWQMVLLDSSIQEETINQIQDIVDHADFKHVYQQALTNLYGQSSKEKISL